MPTLPNRHRTTNSSSTTFRQNQPRTSSDHGASIADETKIVSSEEKHPRVYHRRWRVPVWVHLRYCPVRAAFLSARAGIFCESADFQVMRAKTAVVLGAQWGDEGKGKIVDVLSDGFSAVARYAGGHNAGHTVIISGQKFVLQLIPCGVLRPDCMGIIGNGVVLDPIAFLKEVARIRELGVDVDAQLRVSNRAQV